MNGKNGPGRGICRLSRSGSEQNLYRGKVLFSFKHRLSALDERLHSFREVRPRRALGEAVGFGLHLIRQTAIEGRMQQRFGVCVSMSRPGGEAGGEGGGLDRKSVVEGKRGDLGGRRIIKKKKKR